MYGLLCELDYFEPKVMEHSVRRDYDSVSLTGQIQFFVRGADELYLDLNNSQLEIKFKITLEKGNDCGSCDSMGPRNDILNALVMSMEIVFGNLLVTDPNTKYSYRAVNEHLITYKKL